MNIWFAANISPHSMGGVQRSITELATHLSHKGHQIRICYNQFPNINYICFSLLLLVRLLCHWSSPPDWIIARSTDGFFCTLALKLIPLKTKLALHSHGWEEIATETEVRLPSAIITNRTTWKAKSGRFPILRLTLQYSDISLHGTAYECRWLSKKYPFCRKKTHLLYNGAPDIQSPFWLTEEAIPRHFLCVATDTWKKNIQQAVRLFEPLYRDDPGARLCIVGTGEPPALTFRYDDTKTAITIIEKSPPEQMRSWYRTYPFLICPSRFEGGHTLSALEAMAEGCLVFASAIYSHREFILDKTNGFLFSSGTESILETVKKLEKRRNFRKRIQTAAAESARQRTWQSQSQLLEHILTNV